MLWLSHKLAGHREYSREGLSSMNVGDKEGRDLIRLGPLFAGERFAIELTPSTFPQRHFAEDMFPQRHVAGEKVGMLLGKASNVVVNN
ncbi:hypothetical protein Tco_0276195 [Tanacetum coccineum]